MKTRNYVTAVARKTESGTLYAVSRLLGVSPDVVYNWRDGTRLPGCLSCVAIAQALGLNPLKVLADVELERAGSAGKSARWKTIAKMESAGTKRRRGDKLNP